MKGLEQYGYDANCDGRMISTDDVFLHKMGAKKDHKDLFVQVDAFDDKSDPNNWRIAKSDIDNVVDAFARAPADAGGTFNPDGQPGINLHIDHFDRGNITAAYRQSRSLGEGEDAPKDGSEWDDATKVLQSGPRTGLFRFGMVGPVWEEGVGGYGGGDFIYLERTDDLALMHELGHTFGLGHGGNDSMNCKPNHLSVMNYLYGKFGVPYRHPKKGLSRFLDFAPALIPPAPELTLNARIPDLSRFNIDENTLSEAEALVPTTSTMNLRHVMIIVGPDNFSAQVPISEWPNWNQNFEPDPSDASRLLPVQDPDTVKVQLDVFENVDGGRTLDDCVEALNGAYSALNAFDEWRNMRVKPNRDAAGEYLPGAVVEVVTETAAWADLPIGLLDHDLHRGDLAIAITTAPNPVHVGETATTTINVLNRGPNPADVPQVFITIPDGLTSLALPPECDAPVLGRSTCNLPIMNVGERKTLQFTGKVGENLTGGPRQISVEIRDAAGTDPKPSNNVASTRLRDLPLWSSFEDVRKPWLQAWNKGAGPFPSSTMATHGERSMAVSCGYFDIDSPLFNTTEWDVISDRIALDVYVPSVVPNPTWVGEVALTFVAQAAGFTNTRLGQISLNTLPRGAWSTVEFPVSESVRRILLADTANAVFRVSTNTSLCSDKLLVDNLRFSGSLVERRKFHLPSGTAPVVTSSGVLTFDNAGDWSSPQVAVSLDTAEKTQGTASIQFAPATWTELNSRRFSATELSGVTPLLNVDVFIPSYSSIPGWVGQLMAYFDCPAAGIWNDYIGQVSLDNRFDGEFNSTAAQSALYALSARIQGALSGGYPNCQFRFGLATTTAMGTVRLDRGGFVK